MDNDVKLPLAGCLLILIFFDAYRGRYDRLPFCSSIRTGSPSQESAACGPGSPATLRAVSGTNSVLEANRELEALYVTPCPPAPGPHPLLGNASQLQSQRSTPTADNIRTATADAAAKLGLSVVPVPFPNPNPNPNRNPLHAARMTLNPSGPSSRARNERRRLVPHQRAPAVRSSRLRPHPQSNCHLSLLPARQKNRRTAGARACLYFGTRMLISVPLYIPSS